MKNNYGRNWATVVLVCLFLAFLLILYGKIAYPSIWWSKLQIVVEGALVGGLADWFAVTALFRKPLGFPFHTALLPRKRQSFIKGTLQLMEQEFLARKKIYNLIQNLDLKRLYYGFISQPELGQKLAPKALEMIMAKSIELKKDEVAKLMIAYAKAKAKDGALDPLMDKLVNKITKEDFPPVVLNNVLAYLQSYMSAPERNTKIAQRIKKYVESKQNGMTMAIAYATNAFNPEELGELITKYVQELIAYCGEKDGYMYGQLIHLLEDLQREFQAIYYNQGQEPKNNELKGINREYLVNFCQLVINHPLSEILLREYIGHVQGNLEAARRLLLEDEQAAFAKYPSLLTINNLVAEIIQEIITKLKENPVIGNKVEGLIRDFLQRIALGGEKWILDIAKDLLDHLGAEDLNNLVYPKVRRDLIWIRLNGSIVGGILALVFVIGQHLLGV